MAQAMVGIENGSSHHMAFYQKDIEEDLLFFTNIDEATKIWLNTLHDMWKLWKKCEGITKTLFDYFDTAPNPYLSTLRILVNTIDFKHAKIGSSLAFTVIEEFSNWLVPRKDSYKECLVPDLKIAAFKLLNRQKNMQLIKMVSVTYGFIEHKELFLQMIQNIINEKRYKEAAQYATMLRLQMCYTDPEILLLPLILQNKLAVVEDFLFEYPNIQKILVTYLDNLVALGKNMDNKLEQYIETNNIPDVKIGTIQIRPMTKLIARFAKLYNLPPELCPNLNRRRNEGALQFLIHKRYGDGSLNTESWREMIREAVGHDTQLQLETVKSLSMVGETKEGLYWAKTFNIPKEQWPWAISFQAEQYSDGFGIANDILMIRDYIPAISNIKVNGQGCIDVLFLWRKLVEGYNFQFPYKGDQNFTSESLSKLVELCLGSRLNKSDQFSNWEQRPLRESQIIYAALDAYCLLEIYTTLAQECEHTDIPFQDICAEIQHIPHRHFKKTPKKYLDRSNAKMQSTLSSEKNNFQNGSNTKQFKKVLQTYHNSSNRKNFTKQENKQKQYQLYPQNPSGPIPAHSWRAVCDSMLGGLASKLRMCGCDCLYVLFDKGGEQSAKLAVHENRILLTQRFTQYLPLENCYKVISSTPNEQLREVLSHFSVIVTQKDILSRCQFCNFDEFVEVPKALMDELVRSFINITKHEFHNNELDQPLSASQYPEDLEEVNKIYFKDHFTKQNRTWHLSTGTLDVKTCTTKYHMRVQINKVPLNILRKILLFYVCEHCGNIYWDGIHLEQILNGAIQDLIIKE
ncbi:exonuclease mut-7 homolog isoform X3 [Vespa velutina]|uniref:exonuclease mut-7 homolog isoform X3 n=1 Tax=Vespa velutina TaxID=202808 RepID=UPI001FB46354|nr:exonuclease mut-7 homolog isoform X3 [Vespa velutina]